MHPNAALIEKFYACFQRLDAEGMAQCYHDDISFSDPVFPALSGAMVGTMWKMLCSQARGFELSFDGVDANDTIGRGHWEATYLFSKTGRSVHNKIDATFQFRHGKIIGHQDAFNFWRWSAMALGPLGLLLGWSPLVKHKVRKQAAIGLDRFYRKLDPKQWPSG